MSNFSNFEKFTDLKAPLGSSILEGAKIWGTTFLSSSSPSAILFAASSIEISNPSYLYQQNLQLDAGTDTQDQGTKLGEKHIQLPSGYIVHIQDYIEIPKTENVHKKGTIARREASATV